MGSRWDFGDFGGCSGWPGAVHPKVKFVCFGIFFFFFQAEDGIRDLIVTGVQTCALPIWKPRGGGVYSSLVPDLHFPCHSLALSTNGFIRSICGIRVFTSTSAAQTCV